MEITPEIQAAIEEATSGLVAKNKELLGEVKKLKRGQEIDPQVVADLEAQVEKLQGELTVSQKAAKDAAKVAETVNAQLKAESGFTQKLLVDNGLTDALVKLGVEKHHLPALKALFGSQAQVVVEGDSRIAKIGDKALTEHLAAWAATDDGKHYLPAAANGGGGSQGGAGGGKPASVDLSKHTGSAKLDAAREASKK